MKLKNKWKEFVEAAKSIFWLAIMIIVSLLMVTAVIFSILNKMGFRFVIKL